MTVSDPNPKPGAAILLVDDNSQGLVARRSVLEELGYRITPASSAAEALGFFERDQYDLVITDYKMPAMNGLELIARIRERRPATGIILLSGFVDALGFDEKSTGADIVIQKSANEIQQLVRSVQRLLNRKAQRIPPRAQPARGPSRAKSTSA